MTGALDRFDTSMQACHMERMNKPPMIDKVREMIEEIIMGNIVIYIYIEKYKSNINLESTQTLKYNLKYFKIHFFLESLGYFLK